MKAVCKRKIVALLLAISLVFSLMACGGNTAGGNDNGAYQDTEDVGDVVGTRIITDGYGREVEIPSEIHTIIPLGNAPRLITYLGLADRVIAVPSCEVVDMNDPTGWFKPYAYVNYEQWKDLPIVGNDSSGAGEWYAEEIVAANADLIITTYAEDVAEDIQAQTGIPVLALPSPDLFSEDYYDAFRLIADACGVTDRAEELIRYLQTSLEDLSNRVKNISDEDKPAVLAAAATFSGSHSIDGVYANYPVFKVLDANDVALGISEKVGGVLVDKEQILAWDPEMIFFDSRNVALVQEDYQNDPTYFNSLQAVRNSQLYQWPNSTSHYSNVEVPLASAYYVGAMLYPDAFADLDIDAKISEIFNMFVGAPDYKEVYESIDCYYGKVTLGE